MAGFHDRPTLTQQGHASRCFFLKCSNTEDLIPGLLAVAMPLDESVKKELTDAVQDAQKSGIVQGMQKVLALLSKHGLLQSQVIEPSLVGVHPSNRDGLGIVPHSVHQLLEDIASVGFDSRQCDPMCTDVAPGDREIERFNLQLAESSQGTIPVIEANKLKYVSLSCSHTNTALRCIIMGAPHQYEGSQLTINGKLQLEQVRLKDPAMAQSAETGLTWRVINHEAMSVEGLADLLQAAANTSAQLSRGESEFQILRRVINMINVKGSAGQVQFAAVKSTIMRTKPQCSDAIPDMFTFLVRHGAAKHLQEKLLMTEQRMKACKVECRSLGKDFFHALGMDPKDTRQDPLVILRHAVLAFGYCNPNPKQISVQDVRKLAVKDPVIHEKLKKGQEFLKKMRAMYGSNPKIKDLQKEDADEVSEALHCFEDNVVLFVMDKKIAFPSLQHIGWSFVDAVEKITGFKITNEFDGYPMKETASSSKSKPTEKSSTYLVSNSFHILYMYVSVCILRGLKTDFFNFRFF